ncbi:MAG: SCO family protein [Anaerolineae bacterium]
MKRAKVGLGLTLILMVLLLTSLGCQAFDPPYEFKGATVEPAVSVPDFELKSTSGKPFHLSDVKGDITLIYFGYTTCPDVCPLTLAYLKQALTGLPDRDRVHFIFISVDPKRDTPEVLGRYLATFDPTFIGLTDDFAKVEQVMKPYGATAWREEAPDSTAGYFMAHTARVFLVGPDQKLQLFYPHGFQPDALRSDLAYLLKNKL